MRHVGWSSEPLLGSTDADGLAKIGRISIARRSHSCASHPSASCSENFAIPLDVPGQTLKLLSNPAQLGKPFVVSRAVPAERAETLRAGFDAALRDPQLREDAGKLKVDI